MSMLTRALQLAGVAAHAAHAAPVLSQALAASTGISAAAAAPVLSGVLKLVRRGMTQVAYAAASDAEPTPIPEQAGRIHSVDSFSAVDGPGVRMVVFEQVSAAGCAALLQLV